MSMSQNIATLKAVRKQAEVIFGELEALAQADKKAPATVLTRLSKLARDLDATARQAARDRREQIIAELSQRIRQYDVLLTLSLPPSSRATIKAERATLVAQRGYHRGRLGTDFEGIVSKQDVDKLEALINEVNAAVAGKKKAVAYIDGVIRIGIAASKILARIAA